METFADKEKYEAFLREYQTSQRETQERADRERARQEQERADRERARQEQERADRGRAPGPRALYQRPRVWIWGILGGLAGIGAIIAFLVLSTAPTPSPIKTGTVFLVGEKSSVDIVGANAGLPALAVNKDLTLIPRQHSTALQADKGQGIVALLAHGTDASFQTCASAISPILQKEDHPVVLLTKIRPGEAICVFSPDSYDKLVAENLPDVLVLIRVKNVVIRSANRPEIVFNFTTWSWK